MNTKSCGSTDAEMEYTAARTEGGKWLLYFRGKLVKPSDYVPSDFSVIVKDLERHGFGSDKEMREPAHSSGPTSSQYAFANIGIQATAASIDSRKAGTGTHQAGEASFSIVWGKTYIHPCSGFLHNWWMTHLA